MFACIFKDSILQDTTISASVSINDASSTEIQFYGGLMMYSEYQKKTTKWKSTEDI